MTTSSIKLPGHTFIHHPDRGYTFGGDGEQHIVQSPAFATPTDFHCLVLSIDYHAKPQEWILTEVQVCQDGEWSNWFKLAFYSPDEKYSFGEQETSCGALYVDVLRLYLPAQAYRYRLTIKGEADIPQVTVCVMRDDAQIDPFSAVLPEGEEYVKVPSVSQMELPVSPDEQKRLCSPTSLCMALKALGVKESPSQTMAGVYDKQAQIYGNWTFNTAYACSCGLDACVTQFKRLNQLKEYINKRSLVLATIGYSKGELTDAAIDQTPGHLVVVCGWQNGFVRVADPAAATADEVQRFYHADEFARAWLINKRGMAYLVRKK